MLQLCGVRGEGWRVCKSENIRKVSWRVEFSSHQALGVFNLEKEEEEEERKKKRKNGE